MKLFLILFLLVLSGCSSIYHKKEGWVPEGYTDQIISEREYIISFQAYRGESWAEIESYLLLRAAEIGKQKEYAFFAITDKAQEKKEDQLTVREYSVSIPASGDGSIPLVGPITPQYTHEYSIRILTAKVMYSHEQLEHQYSVNQILMAADVE